MKKDTNWKDELVTKGYFRKELNRALAPLKKADAKLREEMHAIEYRLDTKIDTRFFELSNKMDERFNNVDDILKKHLDAVRELADSVIVKHNKFEQESASIHYNYQYLEGRVKKVEEVVFPETEKV